MANGTCPECGKPTPLGKRGQPLTYCSRYCSNKRFIEAYKVRNPRTREQRQAEYFDRTCIVCAVAFRSARRTGKYCSDGCKTEHYRETRRTKCKLPADHPVILQITEMKAEAKRQVEDARRSKFAWRTARECPGCACWFTPLYTSTTVCCSLRCSRRMTRRRRRAREHNTLNDWRWSDFMRIVRKFDYRCAYCGERDGQLEPDHVVPLSRGGNDSISNLLPSCHVCNADKNARTLPEWAAWRADRGKPPRRTSWGLGDPRYVHLTDALLLVA